MKRRREILIVCGSPSGVQSRHARASEARRVFAECGTRDNITRVCSQHALELSGSNWLHFVFTVSKVAHPRRRVLLGARSRTDNDAELPCAASCGPRATGHPRESSCTLNSAKCYRTLSQALSEHDAGEDRRAKRHGTERVEYARVTAAEGLCKFTLQVWRRKILRHLWPDGSAESIL